MNGRVLQVVAGSAAILVFWSCRSEADPNRGNPGRLDPAAGEDPVAVDPRRDPRAVVPGQTATPVCTALGRAGQVCGVTEARLPLIGGALEMPILAATVDGKPVRLLVDTGASATILSATLLKQSTERWVSIKALCFGDLCLRGGRAWARDSGFSKPGAGDINGLIGMETLKHFVVELDQLKTITLARSRAACAGASTPLTFDQEGRPHVATTIDGESLGSILLDTGALFTLLSKPTAAKAPYLGATASAAGGCSIEGCTETNNFTSTIKRFCVGSTCRDQVKVKYPVWDAVGSTFLSAYKTQMDFAQRRITFCN